MTSLRFEDIIRLAHSVDSACENSIGEARVANAVEVWRPNLERDIDYAIRQELQPPEEPQRAASDMIEELVETVRDIQRRLVNAELEAQNREAPEELARRHVRSALSQFHVTNAKLIDISPTAITITFREQPEPQLISLLESIANLHGMSLYTYLGNP
jgi:hypothetical protein